jgi:parallel beta-helix repeat protein
MASMAASGAGFKRHGSLGGVTAQAEVDIPFFLRSVSINPVVDIDKPALRNINSWEFKMNVVRQAWPVFLMMTILTLSSPAQAFQLCVSTATEFKSALINAQLITVPMEIRVQQGTYNISNMHGTGSQDASPARGAFTSIGYKFRNHVTITGGWNAGCTARSLNPALTTINGQNSDTSRLYLDSRGHSITVEGMQFLQTAGLRLSDDRNCQPNGQALRVRRVIFRDTVMGASDQGTLTFSTACHQVRAENNLISGNIVSGLKMECRGSSGQARYRLIHNTIRNVAGWGVEISPYTGSGTHACGGNVAGENGLYNNIVQSVRLVGTLPVLQHNIYDNLSLGSGGGAHPGSSNNLTVDPELDSNLRPSEPNSPAINSGTANVPGGLPDTDIEGTARTIGTHPDRGAYESSVNNLFLLSVTNNNDSGSGSLRSAIEQANASPTLQAIQFNIPGSCPQTINLASPLPPITNSLIINGWSQSDASPNTREHGSDANICVVIRRGASVPAADVPRALDVPASASNTTLTVRGIAFGGFIEGGGVLGLPSAIRLSGGTGHRIEGNQFGSIGATTLTNRYGLVFNAGENVTNVIVGGPGPGQRNTFTHSTTAGILILSSNGEMQIINNYIGTRPDGLAAAPNQDGIWISSSPRNEIRDNLISGNSRDGVRITGFSSQYNLIAGNKIGGRRFHTGILPCIINDSCPPIPTNRKGVMIENDAVLTGIGLAHDYDTIIGSPNVISHNTQHAVRIMSGFGNWVLRNSIFEIDGSTTAIDIGDFGVNPIGNDCPPEEPPFPANLGQNRPVVLVAEASGSSGTVSGTLTSCATETSQDENARNTIQFFVTNSCHSSGYGPGRTYVGERHITVPGAAGTLGTASFTAPIELPIGNLAGRFLTATATNWNFNTSEFSACVEIQAADAIFHDRFRSQ